MIAQSVIHDASVLFQAEWFRQFAVVLFLIVCAYIVFRPLREVISVFLVIGLGLMAIAFAIIAIHALSVAGML